jgi:signal recognition particle subunit SRP54
MVSVCPERMVVCGRSSDVGAELDSDGKCFVQQPSRMMRISCGSGTHPDEVDALIKSYKQMAEVMKKMGGKNGLLNMMGSGGAPGKAGMSPAQMAKMQKQMMGNPQMMKQMGTSVILARWVGGTWYLTSI